MDRENIPGHLRIAAGIERLLAEVTALQKTHVSQICSGCAVPCCTKVNYLFCEKDILFFKLSGRKHRWRRAPATGNGCRFLGPSGCFLDPASRPFICHRTICPDLKKAIERRVPGRFTALMEKFEILDELRSRMWAEYLNEGLCNHTQKGFNTIFTAEPQRSQSF